MIIISTLVPLLLATTFSALFLLGAVTSGSIAARSKLELIDKAVLALLFLVVLNRTGAWDVIPSWLWLVPAGLAAVGAVGSTLRWTALPLVREGRRLSSALQSTIGSAVIVLAVCLVLLWPH